MSDFIKLENKHLIVIKTTDDLINNIVKTIHFHNTKIYDPHYLRKRTYNFNFAILDHNLLSDQMDISPKIIIDKYLKNYNQSIELFDDFSLLVNKIKKSDNIHYMSGPPLFPIFTTITLLIYNPYIWLRYKNDFVDPPFYHLQLLFTSQLIEEKIL